MLIDIIFYGVLIIALALIIFRRYGKNRKGRTSELFDFKRVVFASLLHLHGRVLILRYATFSIWKLTWEQCLAKGKQNFTGGN